MRHILTTLVLSMLVLLAGCDDKAPRKDPDAAQRDQAARAAKAKHNAADAYHTQLANATARIGEDAEDVLKSIAAFDGSADKTKELDAAYAKLSATMREVLDHHEATPSPDVPMAAELKAAGRDFLTAFDAHVTGVLGPLIEKLKLSFSDKPPAGIDAELDKLKKEWSSRSEAIVAPMEKVEEAFLKANGME